MIFIILGLFLAALWYVADKQLGARFESYIKWPALAIIVFFLIFDVNMMLETSRFIDVRVANPAGIEYVDTNLSVTTVMYGQHTEDTGTIMAYHYSELAIWPILTGLLPDLFLAIGGYMVLQMMMLWYDDYRGVKRENVYRQTTDKESGVKARGN